MRRPAAMTAAGMAVVLSAAICLQAQPAGAADTSLCQQGQHLMVKTRYGLSLVVRNDFWGTNSFCLSNAGLGPNFKVAKTGVNTIGGRVMSFPYIFRGCSWGICSGGSGLPAQVSALSRPASSWQTTAHAAGTWNAAYDMWFARHRMTTGQADGAELMIWLSTRNLPLSSTRIVRIDNTQWYLAHWVTAHNGAAWNYIQFRRVSPVQGVTRLRLGPFFRMAESRGWIRPSWWLLNMEAGFEIWRGGQGLATNSFWARP